MIKLVRTQCKLLTHQKTCIFCFFALLAVISINFINNVRQYWNVEAADMPSFLNISTLSDEMSIGWYIIQFFPFLLALPGGLSLAVDRNTSERELWIERCGKGRYIWSRIVAVLIVTFLCFFLPFLLEIFLNCIAFPVNAHGNIANMELYSVNYNIICQYFMFSVYYHHPILYAIIMSMIIGGMAALLSILPMVFSMFVSKYYAYLLLPVYLLLSLVSAVFSSMNHFSYNSKYYLMLQWCHGDVRKEDFFFWGGLLLGVAIFSIIVILLKSREDTL